MSSSDWASLQSRSDILCTGNIENIQSLAASEINLPVGSNEPVQPNEQQRSMALVSQQQPDIPIPRSAARERAFTDGIFLSSWRPPESQFKEEGCGLLIWEERGLAELLWVSNKGQKSKLKSFQMPLSSLSVAYSPSQKRLSVFTTGTTPDRNLAVQQIELLVSLPASGAHCLFVETSSKAASLHADQSSGAAHMYQPAFTDGAESAHEALDGISQPGNVADSLSRDCVTACMVAGRRSKAPFTVFKVIIVTAVQTQTPIWHLLLHSQATHVASGVHLVGGHLAYSTGFARVWAIMSVCNGISV